VRFRNDPHAPEHKPEKLKSFAIIIKSATGYSRSTVFKRFQLSTNVRNVNPRSTFARCLVPCLRRNHSRHYILHFERTRSQDVVVLLCRGVRRGKAIFQNSLRERQEVQATTAISAR